MTFFNILKSLDELLYELMTWLVFYPVTLWRSIRRPLSTMAYARAELERDHAEQFRQTLSPPVFLLVTIPLNMMSAFRPHPVAVMWFCPDDQR